MHRTCIQCNSPIPQKAEWCPKCGAIAPGTIKPSWALLVASSVLIATFYCLYQFSVSHKPNYLLAAGPGIPLGYKFLATFLRLVRRHKSNQAA
jgi:hypothetical protein